MPAHVEAAVIEETVEVMDERASETATLWITDFQNGFRILDEAAIDVSNPNQHLAAMAKRLKTLQQRIAKTVFEMSAEVETARGAVSDRHLHQFLVSDCGIDPAEVHTFVELDRLLGNDAETFIAARASFSALKTLAASPADVRAEALESAARGRMPAERDLRAINRRIALREADPADLAHGRRLSVMGTASGRLADLKVSRFRKLAAAFAGELVAFYNAGLDDVPACKESLLATREKLKKDAGTLLRTFRQTFDIWHHTWRHEFHGSAPEEVRLSKAHDALRDLSAGRFQQWDIDSHIPFDTSHDFIDRSLVEDVIWLSNGSGLTVRKVPAQAAEGVTLTEPVHRLSSLEICAGAGGQAVGLHAAGFDALGVYEMQRDAVATLRANYPFGPVYEANIRDVDFTQYEGRVDLVAGGVPCQAHSILGRRQGRADERDLFLEAVRVVRETCPRAFFFENVSGFAMKNNASYRAELYHLFKGLGYDSKVFAFRADGYGLAQKRPRVAFIGFRDGLLSGFRMPPPVVMEPAPLGEAIYDIVARNGWEGARAWADAANVVGPTIVGGSKSSGIHGFASNFQAVEWERVGIDPSALADEPPMPGHEGPFRLTLEMGARLQGFPDGWQFHGNAKSRKRQVANALPPVMSRAVGLAIHSTLSGIRFDYEKALRKPFFNRVPGPLERLNIARRGIIEPEFA